MGVYHFTGLGGSIGGVTCAIDWIERALDEAAREPSGSCARFFSGSGGVNHWEMDRGKVECLVIFTSLEVIQRELLTRSNEPIREALVRTLRQVWKRSGGEGRVIRWVEVPIDDFDGCFERVLLVASRYGARGGRQGKEIWCNLTAGNNAVNMALASMAQLTGISRKQYLLQQSQTNLGSTRVPDGVAIDPERCGYFKILPYLKTSYDSYGLYRVLEELKQCQSKGETNANLLSRLRRFPRFMDPALDESRFVRQYLLPLFGLGYIERPDETSNVLTPAGHFFIDDALPEQMRAIELDERLESDQNIVEESRTWPWLTEQVID